ncbi:MAG: zinc-binding dehydrogenase [Candidatus Marinimicrobia bacterium]|nr:zinc-binding dehydrogenase [Candidatus Neomarinimicrobiota bacterium]
MKAVLCTKYGPPDVLKLADIEKPTPGKNEVCIRIHATAVTASDIFIRSSQLPLRFKIPMRLLLGITKPRKPVIGIVLAGEIESAGEQIQRFKPGDQVYGVTGFNLGAYAEYACMKEKDSTRGCLAVKPDNISYEESTAAAYGGLLALQFADKGNIQKGQHVVVYGASGTSGTIALQYAKYLGAEVTGVCSGSHVELVRSLGADHAIDYTTTDTPPADVRYDFALDAVGKMKSSIFKEALKNELASDGNFASIDDGDMKLVSSRLNKVKELTEAGHIKPIIDRTYPLDEIVDAHRYVEKGHKTGGVAISVV